MPILPVDILQRTILDSTFTLPSHKTSIPPESAPKTLMQAIFGHYPVRDTIEKIFYEHKFEGYYNFYVYSSNKLFPSLSINQKEKV